MNSYHNTNQESGKVLEASEKKAIRQEEMILDYFKNNDYMSYSSEDIFNNLYQSDLMNTTPLTSVRRAICNLVRDGKLVVNGKTDGSYGKKIFTYKLVK